jgi:hypothetical protein
MENVPPMPEEIINFDFKDITGVASLRLGG